ncbi:hypothetical protein NERG_01812 [Nematocida ausubeli]|uniref:Uncharacterized protein n=1 Tax=Nematocida ausubeli (strain ATCC PRA-371 / ERTm2) TaxID=1913371 RepID=H8ZDZ1_NEMA1|nr:hypothetical protein NERG_01812 [Nematocida ausubeli]
MSFSLLQHKKAEDAQRDGPKKHYIEDGMVYYCSIPTIHCALAAEKYETVLIYMQ